MGSKSQRGLTQLSLDLLFKSVGNKALHPGCSPTLASSLIAADTSEAQIQSASGFLEGVYGDGLGGSSRATTPMTVGREPFHSKEREEHLRKGLWQQWDLLGLNAGSEQQGKGTDDDRKLEWNSKFAFWTPPQMRDTKTKTRFGDIAQDASYMPRRNLPQRPSALPTTPDISSVAVASTANMDYTVLVSMYEVYNARIFDLLSHPRNLKDNRRLHNFLKTT